MVFYMYRTLFGPQAADRKLLPNLKLLYSFHAVHTRHPQDSRGDVKHYPHVMLYYFYSRDNSTLMEHFNYSAAPTMFFQTEQYLSANNILKYKKHLENNITFMFFSSCTQNSILNLFNYILFYFLP